jgi:hypothetical protein
MLLAGPAGWGGAAVAVCRILSLVLYVNVKDRRDHCIQSAAGPELYFALGRISLPYWASNISQISHWKPYEWHCLVDYSVEFKLALSLSAIDI